MDPETIGFKAVPDNDPAFYLNADPDSGSQTNADPGSGSDMKIILYVGT
jgi:hypothetical protein